MDVTVFLLLLSAFSSVSSLVTEGIKNFAADKSELSYNIVALVTALLIGGGGTALYYQLNALPFTVNNIIHMALMGMASGLVSMVGFDKVKQAIEQVIRIKG